MNPPQKPAPPLPPKTDYELIALVASPASSTPDILAAAKAELRQRMEDYDTPRRETCRVARSNRN